MLCPCLAASTPAYVVVVGILIFTRVARFACLLNIFAPLFFVIWILLMPLPLVLLLVLVYCSVLCWCWCWPLCGFLLSRRRPAKYILNNGDGAAAATVSAAGAAVSAIFTTFGQSVSLKYKCRLCSQCVLDVRIVKEKTTHTQTHTRGRTHTDRHTHSQIAAFRVVGCARRCTSFFGLFLLCGFFPSFVFSFAFFLLAFLSPNTRATHDDSSSLKTIHSG